MINNRPPPWPDGAVIYHRPSRQTGWYTGKWIMGESGGNVVVMLDEGTDGVNTGTISETWWPVSECELRGVRHLRVVKGGRK